MGLFHISGHYSESPSRRPKNVPPNPNPANFEIQRVQEKNGYLVVRVRYPDCTNFEGNKTLVLRDCSEDEVRKMKMLDPHFVKEGSVIARFLPTKAGWEHAMMFVSNL